jgi:hypothetical protein
MTCDHAEIKVSNQLKTPSFAKQLTVLNQNKNFQD